MKLLKALDRITLTWWFGHALLLCLALSVLIVAVVMEPSAEVLTLFGEDVPVMCGWRRVTGIPCLGCGLTRSFTFMAHGAVMEAFRMNFLGPPMFALVVGQIPWRAFRLWQGARERAAR